MYAWDEKREFYNKSKLKVVWRPSIMYFDMDSTNPQHEIQMLSLGTIFILRKDKGVGDGSENGNSH